MPLPPLPYAWRRLHADTLAALLRAEQQTRRALGRATDPAFSGSPDGLAGRLETGLSGALVTARRRAREAAWRRFRAELGQLNADARVRRLPPLPVLDAPPFAADSDAAELAKPAANYAEAAVAAFDKARADGVPKADAFRAARASQLYRLDMDAATETSQAFNRTREALTDRYAVEQRESRLLPLIGKVWDATLDKRTCPTCARLDGATRPWGVSFPGGVTPGVAHVMCRCVSLTLPLPIFYRTDTD